MDAKAEASKRWPMGTGQSSYDAFLAGAAWALREAAADRRAAFGGGGKGKPYYETPESLDARADRIEGQ